MADATAVEVTQPERAGIYIRPDTRDRLNMYKSQRRLVTGTFYSQSDAIEELLDIAEQSAQSGSVGGPRQS